MATRIIEYSSTHPHNLAVLPGEGAAQAALTASGTSAASAAFASDTRLVLVQSDEAINIKFGANPTATANDVKIVAGGEREFSVTPGHKVAVITS